MIKGQPQHPVEADLYSVFLGTTPVIPRILRFRYDYYFMLCFFILETSCFP